MSDDPLMEVVDNNDNIIGTYPRSQIRRDKMSYRLIAIFVFNNKGELFVQKRSPELKRYPDCYDSSVGGHVELGEDYETAAKREMAEELGITEDLEFVGKEKLVYEDAVRFVALFKCTTNKQIKIDKSEIRTGRFMGISQINKMLVEKEKFTPVFSMLFKKFFGGNK
ncbi:MAG TPA: NUDIX domain-containing protein [Nanoarchaeota archaeon]|nr:NUDIX domain-containing protein [Nanoarchaeota archaeon]